MTATCTKSYSTKSKSTPSPMSLSTKCSIPAHPYEKETNHSLWHLGIRNEHLQDLIRGHEGEQGLDDITWLIEAIINLRFADDLIRYLSYAASRSSQNQTEIPPASAPLPCVRPSKNYALMFYWTCTAWTTPHYSLVQTMLSMVPMASTD
jgi:hypothetical protein